MNDDGRERRPPSGEQILRELHGFMGEMRPLVIETHAKVETLQSDVIDLKQRLRDNANHMIDISTRQAAMEATCRTRSQSYDKHTAITRDMLEKFSKEIATQRDDFDEKLQETTERLNVANITGQVREVKLYTIWKTLAIVGGALAAGGGLALTAVKLFYR